MPQPAALGKEGSQRNARDGGRQGKGQIDQGINEAAAGEAVAGQHPGEQQAKEGVEQRCPRRRPEGDAQRGEGLPVADDVPVVGEAELGEVDGKAGERQEQDERDEEQAHAEREAESGQDLQAAGSGHGWGCLLLVVKKRNLVQKMVV